MVKSHPSYRPLQKMFTEVTGRYDLMNRVLTLGFDEAWRKKAITEITNNKPVKVLDLCTGTGDMIWHIARKTMPGSELSAMDYSQPMLQIAKKKTSKYKQIQFLEGDAASIPFQDNHFDALVIGFAFRNLTYKNPDKDKFLQEIHRVIRPGGQFIIAETSQPKNRFLTFLFRLYMKTMVQGLGGFISGNRGAYRYLSKSAMNFYNAKEVCQLLTKTGFTSAIAKPQLGGIAAIYIATK